MMSMVRKNKKALMIVGGIAAVAVVAKVTNDKYAWMDKLKPAAKQLPGVKTPDDKQQQQTEASRAAASQPRGKLPWAVGDVGLWDDENPNYCADCAGVCGDSYSGKQSTQCEMCQAGCAKKAGF